MRRTLPTLVVLSFLVPTAASTWMAAGSFEPDTPYDSAEWMFQDPPPVGASRLYFNVITMPRETVAGASPNVGMLGMRMEPPGEEYHFAILGVWKDCNGDGYVGALEMAVREYSAELADESVCPAVPGPAGSWAPGAHNYNGWVSELVPIAQDPIVAADRRHYKDVEAMVWGDFHRPDERHTFRSCALTPLPRGTTESTGGALNYVECRLEQKGIDGLGTFNAAMETIGDPLDLRFDDANEARSGPVGQVSPLGPEDDAQSAAYVWDCSERTNVGETANETAPPVGAALPNLVRSVDVAAVDPRANEDGGTSVAGFVNHTSEGAPALDDCDTSNDFGHDVYGAAEDDFDGIDPDRKSQAEWNFDYRTGTRGNPPLGLALAPGGAGAPSNDGGVGWLFNEGTTSGWYGVSTWTSKLGPSVARVDFESGGVGLAPAYWLSFYAHVGAATLAQGFDRPDSPTARYGEFYCGEHDTGIHNGWNCDATAWYRNADGSAYPEPYPLARPGQLFQFRDVDCYDGSNALGVPLGTAALGPEPCP